MFFLVFIYSILFRNRQLLQYWCTQFNIKAGVYILSQNFIIGPICMLHAMEYNKICPFCCINLKNFDIILSKVSKLLQKVMNFE